MSISSASNTAKFLQSRQPRFSFMLSTISAYILGRLSRKHLDGRSGGTGIIIASTVGSDTLGQGGNFDMLSLEYVLDRDSALPCRRSIRLLVLAR